MNLYKEIIKLILNGKEPEKAINLVSKKLKPKKFPKIVEVLLAASPSERKLLFNKLKSKPSRTSSGVAPIAVMTSPHNCPHGKCIMCPGGVNSYFGNVPQSYTGYEPATRRAIRNDYNPYLQVFNRLEQYFLLNQYPEKVELIIMGGTFLSYSKKYQENFISQCYKAMNDFSKLSYKKFIELFNLSPEKNLNQENDLIIKNKLLKKIKSTSLEKEKRINETSKIRCVALVIETRPDQCSLEQIKFMNKLGVTRVELGVQSIYPEVLKKLKRGHTLQDSIDSTERLRNNGFKITYHILLGALGSNEKKDIEMFKILFQDEKFKPDGLKIYPCMILKGTELYNLYKKKLLKPLTTEKAIKIISDIKKYIPEYCRVMRIQRDIPSTMIEEGVKKTNLRQYIKTKCRCIRCREVGHKKIIKTPKIVLKQFNYQASNSQEIFLSYEDVNNDALIGFLRLRLIKNKAHIRELHIYGNLTNLGKKGDYQHKGYGKLLLKKAEEICKQNKIKEISIISGIGVREYYKKLGYKLENNYMVKKA